MPSKDVTKREIERIASEIKAILQKYVNGFDCSRHSNNNPGYICINTLGQVWQTDEEIDDSLEVLCRHYNDFFAYDYDDGEEVTDDNYYLQPLIYEPEVLDVAKEAVEDLVACSPRWRKYIEMRQRVIENIRTDDVAYNPAEDMSF